MIGYQKVKKFSRFDTTHDRDGQIDGQTDRRTPRHGVDRAELSVARQNWQ